jgi:RHS repeat-associated protein
VQQFIYLYSYNQAGRVTFQDMRLEGGAGSAGADLYATYSWDNMGRMTALNYPFNGPQVAMAYDAMSNLSSETQNSSPLANATYNFAGQLTALNYNYSGGVWQQAETHTYNGMMQLTNITNSGPSGAQVNMTYNFSATQNNGRIVSSADAVTGENVSYTYDSLNRLIAAATTNRTGPIWGNSYSYDGFGNLTGKTVTQGSAPSASPQVDPTTNRARMIGDYGFDANGNWLGTGSQSNAWNVENQLISNGMVDYGGNPLTYTYDPWGKRVLQYSVGGVYGPTGTIYFYSITGQRLATYTGQYPNALTQTSVNMYFGSRLLAPVDRLGSVRQNGNGPIAYYPWGEERTSTADGTDKFATYFRDATNNGIGEDYASARYYNNNNGRFWSPDPAGVGVSKRRRGSGSGLVQAPTYRPGVGSAHRKDPLSWNRYAYALDDPINHSDPTGLTCVAEGGYWQVATNDDGSGCSYAGKAVTNWGTVGCDSSACTESVTSVAYACTDDPSCDDSDVAITGVQLQTLVATGDLLNSVSVGGFTYVALDQPVDIGGTEVEGLLLNTADITSGTSTSTMAEEGTVIDGVFIGAGVENNLTNGESDSLGFLGLQFGAFGLGILGSMETGTFGVYAGLGPVGGGVYVTLGGSGP